MAIRSDQVGFASWGKPEVKLAWPQETPTPTPTPAVVNRKDFPLATGMLDYFPDALMAVAHVSFTGNKQHNPGQPLHWDRSKSTDQADTLLRHARERGTFDDDGEPHSAKLAWRALANLQIEIEAWLKMNPGKTALEYLGQPQSPSGVGAGKVPVLK